MFSSRNLLKQLYGIVVIGFILLFIMSFDIYGQSDTEPETAQEFLEMGLVLASDGELEQAIEAFDEALELDDTLTDVYFWRGVAYSILGETESAASDWEQAVELYTHVIEEDPASMESAIAFLGRGRVGAFEATDETYIEDLEAAIKLFSHFIETDAEDAASYYYRGLAYSLLSDYEQAIADYEMAEELDSTVAEQMGLDPFYAYMYPIYASGLMLEIIDTGVEEECRGNIFLCTQEDMDGVNEQLSPVLDYLCKYVSLVGEDNVNADTQSFISDVEMRVGDECPT